MNEEERAKKIARIRALGAIARARQAMPDLRLGQILINAVTPLYPGTSEAVAVWEATDEEIIQGAEALIAKVTT